MQTSCALLITDESRRCVGGVCGIRPSNWPGPYPGHPCESLDSWDDWLTPVGTKSDMW